jgi:outer membrane protein
MTSKLATLTLAALCTLAGPAQAQSLKDLYEAARTYDATFLAARAQAESAQYRAAQAEALNLPSVGLQAELKRNGYDSPLGGSKSARIASVGVSATQPLYNAVNGANTDMARRSLDVAAADLTAAEQDLIVRVSQAYFDVLAAQDTLTTALANKKGISEQLASAKRNFEVGTATITDTREAQAKADLVNAQVIAAENDLRTKRVALDQLVGGNGVNPFGLKRPTPLPALAAGSMDDWVGKVEEAPMVRKAKAGLDIAKAEVRRTEAGHKPTVDLNGSLGLSNSRGSYAPSLGGEGTANTNSVGLTLKVPLYAGGAIQNQVREALKLEDKARNDLEGARRALAQGTRTAYLGVESGRARVAALEAAESSSKLALEATQLGYKVGVRVNLDVLNAQTQLFSTQADLAKARYDLLVTSLRLRQAAGTLTAADLEPINALLQP